MFMVAQALPFLVEVWMQQGIVVAVIKYIKQCLTLAPFHFIFQSKVIGIYVAHELRIGGAQYVATGRGLPTQRVHFLTLYQNFAQTAFYDGTRLLTGTIFILMMGGASTSASLFWVFLMLALTIISWLYAPFIFNPYQFSHRYFRTDIASLREFFLDKGAKSWTEWYERTQLYQTKGLRVTVSDIFYWLFLICVWYTTVGAKMHVYYTLIPGDIWQVLPILPPMIVSFIGTAIAAATEPNCGGEYTAGAAPTFHLAIVAPVIALVDTVEALSSLGFLISIGWWRTVVAALLLKYFLLSWFLLIVESMVGLGWCPKGYFRAWARLWLYSHRMAMDLVVSCLIFCTLSPIVLFDKGRHAVCKSCSFHNLIVFRDPGQAMYTVQPTVQEEKKPHVDIEAGADDLSGGQNMWRAIAAAKEEAAREDAREAAAASSSPQDSMGVAAAGPEGHRHRLPPMPKFAPGAGAPMQQHLLGDDMDDFEEGLLTAGTTAAMAAAARGTQG